MVFNGLTSVGPVRTTVELGDVGWGRGVTVALGEMDVARVTAPTVRGSLRGHSHWNAALQPAAGHHSRGGPGSATYPADDVHQDRSDCVGGWRIELGEDKNDG